MGDPGVVDQDVDAALLRHDRGEHLASPGRRSPRRTRSLRPARRLPPICVRRPPGGRLVDGRARRRAPAARRTDAAIAAPMPEPAPVTTATFSPRSNTPVGTPVQTRVKYYTLPVKSMHFGRISGCGVLGSAAGGRRCPTSPTSSRREFVKVAGSAALGASLFPVDAFGQAPAKRRYAIVGTGDRASGMWGRDLVSTYPDLLEFVGLCDKNPKRAVVARDFIGVPNCPTFTNFDEMIEKTQAGPADGHDRRRLPPRIHRQRARSRHRRDDREADDDRRDADARRCWTPRSGTTGRSSSPSTTATRRPTSR